MIIKDEERESYSGQCCECQLPQEDFMAKVPQDEGVGWDVVEVGCHGRHNQLGGLQGLVLCVTELVSVEKRVPNEPKTPFTSFHHPLIGASNFVFKDKIETHEK